MCMELSFLKSSYIIVHSLFYCNLPVNSCSHYSSRPRIIASGCSANIVINAVACIWAITKFIKLRSLKLKGVVHRYYFDVKPSNLTACFITKCDAICYYYVHQNGGPWTAVYNNVWALVTFFLAYNVNIDWWEVLYIR